jgi:hypothetical protein
MCGYLEWNLNVGGEEVLEFEAKVRAQHGHRSSSRGQTTSTGSTSSSRSSGSTDASIIVTPASSVYPTPDHTPDVSSSSRPIRPVPSPFKRPSYQSSQPQRPHHHTAPTALGIPPSPPASPHYLHAVSPQPPHFASATSSLQSSPASEDCKTPSPITVTGASRFSSSIKGALHQQQSHKVDMARLDSSVNRSQIPQHRGTSSHPSHPQSMAHSRAPSYQPQFQSHVPYAGGPVYPINVAGW